MSQPDDALFAWDEPAQPRPPVTPVTQAACFLCSQNDVPVYTQGNHLAYGVHHFLTIGRFGLLQCQASGQHLCDLPPRYPFIVCHQENIP